MRTISQLPAEIDLIRAAIRERKQIVASYHRYDRVFCPHILGLKDDKWHVLGWQFGGSSERGGLPDWRCMAIHELGSVNSQEGDWYRGFTKGVRKQFCIDWVDTIVDPAFAAVIAA